LRAIHAPPVRGAGVVGVSRVILTMLCEERSVSGEGEARGGDQDCEEALHGCLPIVWFVVSFPMEGKRQTENATGQKNRRTRELWIVRSGFAILPRP
jgi:hypothetical protein